MSDEELAELGSDPEARLKGMQSAFTKRMQQLASTRKPYEALDEAAQQYGITPEEFVQFIPILNGLRTDPQRVLKQLGETFQDRTETGEAANPVATQVAEKLKAAFGEQVAGEIAPVIAEAVQEAAAAQVAPLAERQKAVDMKAAVAAWRSKNPDVDENLEKQMNALWGRVQSGGMPAVWDILKQAAVASRSNGEKAAEKLRRRTTPAPNLAGKPPPKEGGVQIPEDADIETAITALANKAFG
ncbi:MAG: hypothetical protein ACE5JX_14670 [Acidobacteriota bacterium]